MNRLALFGAIAALTVAAAGSASAAVVTLFVPTAATPQTNYTVIDDFTTLNGITGSGFILSSTSTPAGAQPGNSPPPATPYLDVQAGGTALITFSDLTSSPVTGFEFDWGSVDTFNTLTIHVNGGPDVVVVPPAPGNGSWTSGVTNGIFKVQGDAGETFSGITLQTSQNSFEIDDLAVHGVPEPASWAMMIVGFGAIGFAMRRRNRMFAAA